MPPRQAYIILRRRAELFINLMMLMKDANIPYRPCLAHRRPKPVPRAARVPQSAAHATLGADTAELPHFTKPDLTRFRRDISGVPGRPEDPERQLYK